MKYRVCQIALEENRMALRVKPAAFMILRTRNTAACTLYTNARKLN